MFRVGNYTNNTDRGSGRMSWSRDGLRVTIDEDFHETGLSYIKVYFIIKVKLQYQLLDNRDINSNMC